MMAFVTCDNNNEIDEPDNQPAIIGSSTYIAAKPSKGFNYGYYYYIPKNINGVSKKYLLVEPNNTGKVSDDIKVHDDAAYNLINSGWGKSTADELLVVLLVPVFPRPTLGNSNLHVQALTRATLQVKSGKMARVDLQLIQMINDLKDKCDAIGIKVEPKILLNGFSASAKFANRFTAIHPGLVQAVAAGGSTIPFYQLLP